MITGEAVNYILPCDRPEFRQSLDRTRPFVLLNTDHNGRDVKLPPKRRNHLRYRYTDTGEEVLVPNAPYNQTKEMKAADMRFEADYRVSKVASMRAVTPTGWTPWMVENVAVRVLANAKRLRELADQIESGALPFEEPWNLQSEASPSKGWSLEQEQRERAAGMSAPVMKDGDDAEPQCSMDEPNLLGTLSERDRRTIAIRFLRGNGTMGSLLARCAGATDDAHQARVEMACVLLMAKQDAPEDLLMTDSVLYRRLRERITDVRLGGWLRTSAARDASPKTDGQPGEGTAPRARLRP